MLRLWSLAGSSGRSCLTRIDLNQKLAVATSVKSLPAYSEAKLFLSFLAVGLLLVGRHFLDKELLYDRTYGPFGGVDEGIGYGKREAVSIAGRVIEI